MKKILSLLIAIFVTAAHAQETCPPPEEKVLVVFGNGILTTQDGALRSLDVLQEALGPTFNNQKLSYDLAYNYTDGAFLDLLQSTVQVLSQFDSQVMAWLNHIQLAPGWFNNVLQRLYVAAYTVNAPELIDHVAKYEQAIHRGQKVLVVSHSQGNLYVNEARKLLQAVVTDEQMKSFSIFGVATPANNVGGARGPYFTNHRDIILLTLGALPQNWALHHAYGTLADDVARVPAHSFVDTYMSANYDMRPSLILGIEGQLSSLSSHKAPAPVCENYRKQFIGLLVGSYSGKCNGTVGSASLDKNALVSFPNGTVDLSGPNVAVGSVSRQLVNTSNVGDNRGIGLQADEVGGAWSITGDFEQLMRNLLPMDCHRSTDSPSSSIAAPVDIAAKASQLLHGYRGGFPASRCTVLNKATSQYITPAGWQPVAMNGTTLSIGATDYNLTAGRISEFVAITPALSFSPVDYEPQFSFDSQLVDGSHLFFTYKSIKGLRVFMYDTPTFLTTCNLN
jgi:hypothetical protein